MRAKSYPKEMWREKSTAQSPQTEQTDFTVKIALSDTYFRYLLLDSDEDSARIYRKGFAHS